jgi:hypothetical protein
LQIRVRFLELKPIQFTVLILLEDLSMPETDCHSRAAVVIGPISARSLCKTGIFADKAGDFRRFPPEVLRAGSPETKSNARKAGISGPFSRFLEGLAERTNGWLERQGSNSHIPEARSPLALRPYENAPVLERLTTREIPFRENWLFGSPQTPGFSLSWAFARRRAV